MENAALDDARDPLIIAEGWKGEGRDVAIASFNSHGDFFGRRMNIRLPGGEVAHSGCVAFGLERWAYAFFCQNGLDAARWPAPLRRQARNDDPR